MAALTTKQIVATTAALTPSFSTPTVTVGDTFVPGSRTFICVRTTGTAITVTIDVPGNVAYSDQAKPDVVVSLGATAEKWIGPLPDDPFKDPDTGLGKVICSAITGVSIGVFAV